MHASATSNINAEVTLNMVFDYLSYQALKWSDWLNFVARSEVLSIEFPLHVGDGLGTD
jgi:hypothetical protein